MTKPHRGCLALLSLAVAASLGCGEPRDPGPGPLAPPPPVAPPELHHDPRVAWLQTNAIPVRSTDPSDQDFSDLRPLKAVIGDSRLVMLGEQSHGDGTTFEAKVRLVEFLHQEMGFDVLAWESGLYDVARAWRRIQAGEGALNAAREGILGFWVPSNEVRPLFAYIDGAQASGSPLEIAGFDSQFILGSARETFVPDLESALRAEGSPLPRSAEWARFRTLLQSFLDGVRGGRPAEELDFVLRLAKGAESEFRQRGESSADAAFWAQVMESTQAEVSRRWNPAPDSASDFNERDRQMARNLLWLVRERYPGRKVIVWAATSHILRGTGTLRMPDGGPALPGYVSMGDHVHREFGDSTYVLGFTAALGSHGLVNQEPRPLSPPSVGSLEHLLLESRLGNAIIDFRAPKPGAEWLREPRIGRPAGYVEIVADWTRVMDGVMYTPVMKPSTSGIR